MLLPLFMWFYINQANTSTLNQLTRIMTHGYIDNIMPERPFHKRRFCKVICRLSTSTAPYQLIYCVLTDNRRTSITNHMTPCACNHSFVASIYFTIIIHNNKQQLNDIWFNALVYVFIFIKWNIISKKTNGILVTSVETVSVIRSGRMCHKKMYTLQTKCSIYNKTGGRRSKGCSRARPMRNCLRQLSPGVVEMLYDGCPLLLHPSIFRRRVPDVPEKLSAGSPAIQQHRAFKSKWRFQTMLILYVHC